MKKETQKAKPEEIVAAPVAEKVLDNSDAKIEMELEVAGVKIGPILREARLKQGKKLPDIAQSLCIRHMYLEAIEASRYESIPEFPYGIGFIRSYANYLGLDSAKIIQMYKTETTDNLKKDDKYYVLEPQTEATIPSKKYLLISLLAIMAVYFAWFMFNENNNNVTEDFDSDEAVVSEESNSEDVPLVVEDYAPVSEATLSSSESSLVETPLVEVVPTENIVTPQVVVKETAFVEAKPVETAKEIKSDKSNSRIVVNVKKDTWIEVKDATKLYISKVLPAGESYSVPNGAGMLLSVGRVEGVEVLVDGKPTPAVSNVKKMGVALDSFLSNANH